MLFAEAWIEHLLVTKGIGEIKKARDVLNGGTPLSGAFPEIGWRHGDDQFTFARAGTLFVIL
jgi:hypothetical protein